MGQPPNQPVAPPASAENQLTIVIGEREYDVTPPFTNRELHLIKQVAGVRAGELFDAMEAGDNDMLVALAQVAVRRTGEQRPTLDDLWDMAAGAITVVTPTEDVTADPTQPADPESGSPATSRD